MSRYYLIGIKGAGMSALAQMLHDQEYEVKGCDYEEDYYTTEGLKARGIIMEHFDEAMVDPLATVIVGNAFVNHELVQNLKNKHYTVYSYSEFLGRLSQAYFSIAVAGTHGKTTTTNLCRAVLNHMEPNYVIGDGRGGGNRDSQEFLFEACEYKRHFLHYYPKVAIITNIDFDHPDYFHDLTDVTEAFSDFIRQAKYIIYNGDCEPLVQITQGYSKKMSYGLNETNDFYASEIEYTREYTMFSVSWKGKHFARIKLPLFGQHNIYNALAAIALGLFVGIKKRDIVTALENYQGGKRRFEIIKENQPTIISDYAHHPNEIKAIHGALRQKYPNQEIIAIFEPHTFSRTKQFVHEFAEALKQFDQVFLKDIFTSVREQEQTISIEELAELIPGAKVLHDPSLLRSYEAAILVFMGAGNIDKTAKIYYNEYISS